MNDGRPQARSSRLGPALAGCLLLAVLCAGVAVSAPQTESAPVKPAAVEDKKGSSPPPAKGLDAIKIPANAILVVTEHLADALRMVPSAYVMTANKYEEMVNEIARLKAQLEAVRPKLATPSKCVLKGKVEGNVVSLQAQFDFETDRANAAVFLACGQAQASDVKLAGLAGFKAEADGYVATVEKPGAHQVTLDLQMRLTDRDGTAGFELDLPRAAINLLDLELPNAAREVQVGGKPVGETLLTFKNGRLAGSLRPIDKLDVSWKAASAPGAAPVRTVTGLVQVRLDERQTTLTTEAKLDLQVQGGPVDEWRLVAPAGAEVKVVPEAESRVQSIDKSDLKGASLYTIRLKERGAAALAVTVKATVRGPFSGGLLPVGPLAVLGATRQGGSILVSHAVGTLRLEFHPRGDVWRREATPEERRRDAFVEAAFNYVIAPLPDQPQGPPTPAALTLLDLEPEVVRGQLETRVSHLLRLQRGEGEGEWVWRVTTTIEAAPIKTGVDHLDIVLPPEYQLKGEVKAEPARLIRAAEPDPSGRLLPIKLAAEELPRPFTLTFEGTWQPEGAEGHRATVPLPQPRGTRDRSGAVTVEVPDDQELLHPENANRALELTQEGRHKQVWRSENAPPQLDVTWRKYSPEVRAAAEVDLTLSGREGHVKHTIRFQFAGKAPAQVFLQMPDVLADRFKVSSGGSLAAEPHPAGVRLVNLKTPAGEEPLLVLEYSFPLPERLPGHLNDPFPVPLVVPEQVTQGETEVRVWSEPGSLPLRAGDLPWAEMNVKKVPSHPEGGLPALVLRTQRVDLPLLLRLGEPVASSPVTVLVERALVRASVVEGGGQSYRVSYLLGRLATRFLEVELPAPVPSLNLRVTLDGQPVAWETLDESGQRSDGGRVARLILSPDLVRRPAVLEISYQLPPGRASGGLLQTTLQPPVLRGDPGHAPVRWQVMLPAGWVPLGPEVGAGADRAWSRRGWLWAPRLGVTSADLEHWFAGPKAARADDEDSTAPTLVYWRNGPEPIRLVHVPQQIWLLVCSLSLLVLGLGLYFLPQRRGDGARRAAKWFLPCVALLTLAGAVVGMVWPTLLAAVVYGCEPGAVVLVLFAGIQWLLHERYRRRVVFLPSFSRARTGSSNVRNGSSARPRGEPSTVDAPMPQPSSLSPAPKPPPAGQGSGVSRQGSSAK